MQFAAILKALTLSALFLGMAGAHAIGGACGCGSGCDSCGGSGVVYQRPAASVVYAKSAPEVVVEGGSGYGCGGGAVEVGYGGSSFGHGGSISYGHGGSSYGHGGAVEVAYGGAGGYGHGGAGYGHGGSVEVYGNGANCAACGGLNCGSSCSSPKTSCRTKTVMEVAKRLVPQTYLRPRAVTECTTVQTCQKRHPIITCTC